MLQLEKWYVWKIDIGREVCEYVTVLFFVVEILCFILIGRPPLFMKMGKEIQQVTIEKIRMFRFRLHCSMHVCIDDIAFDDHHYGLFQTHLVRQIKEEKDQLKYDLILYKRIFLNTVPLSIFLLKLMPVTFFSYKHKLYCMISLLQIDFGWISHSKYWVKNDLLRWINYL